MSLLSPVLFNIFLENIMQETLQDFSTTISIGESPICNLRFADDTSIEEVYVISQPDGATICDAT